MGIPLLAGRPFTADDRPGSPRVVVVSQAMAQSYWPGESPVGRHLKAGPPNSDRPWLEIVGVAADVRHQGFDVPTRPKLYLPASQNEAPARTLVLKTSIDPSAVTAAAREAVWDVDPDRPVQRLETLESVVSNSVALPRFRTLLITSLAVLAVLLAIVGVYGVMAYVVAQRSREIGIRMALGARKPDVVRGVLARGLRLAVLGLVVGLGLAAMTLRTLDSFLFEVSSGDPRLLTAAALALAASALAACLVPATRAASVDPAVALRE